MDKKIVCPICESKNIGFYDAMTNYKLAECKNCGMIWEPKPLANILSQYKDDYFVNDNPKGGYTNYFVSMSINRKTFSDRLNKIQKKLGKKGKLLDVGCALGDCLVEAKRLGWRELEGIEVSDYGYKHTLKKGIKVIKGTLKNKTFKPNTFDVVTYQDVIEHITDPVLELKKVYKILKPNGLVYLVTPDVEGFWSKLLGSFWYHYKPHEHVVYFSQKTIREALAKAGFKDIETAKTYHVLTLEYILSRLRYYSSLVNIPIKLISNTPIKNMTFRSYTGELEAWGRKI